MPFLIPLFDFFSFGGYSPVGPSRMMGTPPPCGRRCHCCGLPLSLESRRSATGLSRPADDIALLLLLLLLLLTILEKKYYYTNIRARTSIYTDYSDTTLAPTLEKKKSCPPLSASLCG
jgi:hypothetical protein